MQGKTDGEYSEGESNPLKLDIMTLTKDEDAWRMDIYDAKYYLAHVNEVGKLKNLPGIGDITKEFLYELAYKDFREVHSIEMGQNAFVFPMEDEENLILCKGEIKMKMFTQIGLKPIDLLFVDAKTIFEHYVKGTRLPTFMRIYTPCHVREQEPKSNRLCIDKR